ncbi:YopX family protein [Bacillus inaquosorum]|uniref:YopX family protein n=1 Tax=Bacillus TaxID=1386 RepID=UPI001CDD6B93|nr:MULTISPECIES: YopX family protein [Bacillus]MCY7767999.1 YopX family protein [Bacillus inaquosorum]MCY7977469.1 YopX family protein [Bacillus inaquosorum]MCY9099533.1 YopX family protein [Bacillus inaquosorum]MCY9273518.1 YopX family protein [Bacillus inaquosorum]MEC0589966.1 YopX family protein [Bacillus inaquosorum]
MNTAYRVWDGENMHYWDDEGISLNIEDGNWYLYRKGKFITSNKTACAVLMWGTGLKDKNEKMIYEKDIDMLDREPMIVVMENGHYGLKFLDGSAYFDYSVDWEECEIGGNPYENPELLEGAE